MIRVLRDEAGLSSSSVVADIGSGTGISSALFLKNGNPVFGVEPNREMRAAAEELLRSYPNFRSVDGAAEATALESHSVDFVVAAQAFHWFDLDKARAEFGRILKPHGQIVLLWNARRAGATPFMRAYEEIVNTYGVNYALVKHDRVDDEALSRFFVCGYRQRTLPNEQRLDLAGITGRLLSSSYAPLEGHANHVPMLEALRRIFEARQEDGFVRLEYDTQVYWGQLE